MNCFNEGNAAESADLPDICVGCGAVKQRRNKNALGYAPDTKHTYCYRCFELNFHNQIVDYEWDANRFSELMDFLKKDRNNYFCYLVDIFDLFGSRSMVLEKMFKDNDVCLIINKIDLIAKLVDNEQIIAFVQAYFRQTKLQLKKVFLLSGLKNYGLDELNAHLNEIDRPIYFVGCSNSGKSQLLNALMKLNAVASQLTVSNYPATTMGVLPVNLSDTKTIYDTPGLINYHNMINYVDHDVFFDRSILNQALKPITFQLQSQQTIVFESLGAVSYLGADENLDLHIYMNSSWILHRTNYEGFPEYWKKHHRDDLLKLKQALEMEVHLIEVKPNANKQALYISGCGWITFTARHTAVFELFIPNGVGFKVVTPALI